ncbi:hypothetical protein BDA96_07G159300 [Sorghum bicolor]|uniref:Uncharacterized protein n=2 Tax=Sorghum bicolor TaxID=4558 RepID=A0A921QKE8_SORBI|nr:hypothetical protein BDA96_07G159300 [Sorghum bicolor]OQU80591.1 hypothetical protein SORBI_3007G148266 [Sorghum bicolor]
MVAPFFWGLAWPSRSPATSAMKDEPDRPPELDSVPYALDSACFFTRRDPFEGCPERRPPGATGGGVVLYTTTLRDEGRMTKPQRSASTTREAAAVPDDVDEEAHHLFDKMLQRQ